MPITVRARSVYLGALLERLSKLTGVTIRANHSDGARDEVISVFVDQVPASEIMGAISSVYSYKGAEWRWNSIGPEQSREYRLERPLAARRLGVKLREMIQAEFESDTRLLIQCAVLQPVEREPLVRRFVITREHGDEKRIQLLMSSLGDSMWEGLRLFDAVCPPQTQRKVLRAESVQRVAVDDLSPQALKIFRTLAESTSKMVRYPGGSPQSLSLPTHITFKTEWQSSPPTPSLWIRPNAGVAFAYAGGKSLHERVADRIRGMWLFDDDGSDHSTFEMTVKQPGEVRESSSKSDGPIQHARPRYFDQRLEELSTRSGINIIARPPHDQSYDPGAAYGRRVKDYLETLNAKGHFAKRRGNLHLITSTDWYLTSVENAAVPYHVAAKLGLDSENPRTPTIHDVAQFSIFDLTEEQKTRIYGVQRAHAAYRYWPALFKSIAINPGYLEKLVSEQGLTRSQAHWTRLFQRSQGPPGVESQNVMAVRIRHFDPADKTTSTGYDVELRLRNENVWKRLLRVR